MLIVNGSRKADDSSRNGDDYAMKHNNFTDALLDNNGASKGSLNDKHQQPGVDDYSTYRSQNPMQHNYARVLDLQLNAKNK